MAAFHVHPARNALQRFAEVEPVLPHDELGIQLGEGQAAQIGTRLSGPQPQGQCDRNARRYGDRERVVHAVSTERAGNQPHEETGGRDADESP